MTLEYTPGHGFCLSPRRFSQFATRYRPEATEVDEEKATFDHHIKQDTPTRKGFNVNTKPVEPSITAPSRQPRKRRRLGCLHIFSVLIGALWLVPACFLVYINLTYLIIGAAAWCPGGYCPVISYFPPIAGAEDPALIYDRDNHNLLGALQFAAKAIEVWFTFVAVSLVFTITCLLAKRKGGLPIGYLLTHLEFVDLRALFSPVLWRAPTGSTKAHADKSHTAHLYLFAALVAFMCLVTNLMGPSVAVLLIPTLQWVETPQIQGPVFNQMLSSGAPTGNAIPGCSATQLALGEYSCSGSVYASSLDAMADYSTAVLRQAALSLSGGSIITEHPPTTVEDSISFAFNVTVGGSPDSLLTYWAPNREVMRELSSDFNNLAMTVLGAPQDDTYVPYNNSLSLVLQRQGPIIGLQHYLTASNLSITMVGDQQEVRCYGNFSVDMAGSPVTKCFRKGSGWNSTNSVANFTVGDDSGGVLTTSYWADRTTYFTGDLPNCLPNGTLPAGISCDWDNIFGPTEPPIYEDSAPDALVLEYSLPSSQAPESVFVAEVYPSLGFATYSLDATTIYPTLSNAVVPNTPNINQTEPIILNAEWILAAWSANVSGGTVNASRPSASQLQSSLVNLQNGILNGTGYVDLIQEDSDDWQQWYYLTVYTSLQASSMVNYNTSSPTTAPFPAPIQADANQPILWTNVRRQVWMYGLNSRTSMLGIVVIFVGIATVLARTLLVVATHVKERSAVELIVSALEHEPRHGVFEDGDGELDLARVRFKMHEHEERPRVVLTSL